MNNNYFVRRPVSRLHVPVACVVIAIWLGCGRGDVSLEWVSSHGISNCSGKENVAVEYYVPAKCLCWGAELKVGLHEALIV